VKGKYPRVTKVEARIARQWQEQSNNTQEWIDRQEAFVTEQVIVHMSRMKEAGLRKSDDKLPEDVQEMLLHKEALKKRQWLEDKKIEVAIEEQERKLRALQVRHDATQARISQLTEDQSHMRRKGRKKARQRVINDEDVRENAMKRLAGEYDCLISQLYTCPVTQQLYQIYDVKVEDQTYLSVARPVNSKEIDSEGLDSHILPINGEGGSMELVNNFERGIRPGAELPIPNCDDLWIAAQAQDEVFKQIIDKLEAHPGSILPLDLKEAGESIDYLFLDVQPGRTKGVLKRRSQRTKEMQHQFTAVEITQEYVQTLVPQEYREAILNMMHDSMGHPGRSRTLETLRMRFYWPLIRIPSTTVWSAGIASCGKRTTE